MSGKIDRAYLALGDALGAALFAAGFLAQGESLAIDPAEPVEPDPEPEAEDEGGAPNHASAALLKLETKPVRTLLGGPRPRYVVERSCQLELGLAGPDADWRAETLQRSLGLLAALQGVDPTLGGKAERVEVLGAESDDLPPNGEKTIVTFALRVRSGDPLGISD